MKTAYFSISPFLLLNTFALKVKLNLFVETGPSVRINCASGDGGGNSSGSVDRSILEKHNY